MTQDRGAYRQQLARRIGAPAAAVMTVAAIAPVGSFFVIAPDVFATFGTGFLAASIIALIMCFGIAYCYAELGAVYPIAGGQYSIAARVLGPGTGFLIFVALLSLALIGPTAVGLGVVPYLQEFLPGLPTHVAAPVVILFCGTLACISIKGNATINMVLFFVQVATVAVIVWIGFSHPHQGLGVVLHPVREVDSTLVPVAFATVMTGVALAITVFNGYDGPLDLSEEITEPRKNVPKAILMALCGAALMGFLPALAIVIGAPSLEKMMQSSNPIAYVLESAGGSDLLTKLLVGSVILALVIGNTVAMTNLGRVFYSAGRDRAWPGVVSTWMATINARTRTPVFATLSMAIVAAVLAALNDIGGVLNVGALLLVVIYATLAVSALWSRFHNRDLDRPYRMPLFPLPPVVALIGCSIIIWDQAMVTLVTVGAILVAGGIYYLAYLRPHPDRWVMRDPVAANESPEATALEEAS